ncbi:MAG: SPOR domain-containing protein [Actinomycetota bacterium]
MARLIGQNDPFDDDGSRQSAQYLEPPQQPWHQPSPEGAAHVAAAQDVTSISASTSQQVGSFRPPPELHSQEYAPSAAEYVPVAHEHGIAGYGAEEGGCEPEAHYANVSELEGEPQDFCDDVPPRRRMGVLAVAAVFALAVVGTAGAFGYRALFSSSGASGPPPVIKAETSPAKIVSPKKLVSREEQPKDIDRKMADVLPSHPSGMPSSSIEPDLDRGMVGSTPRKIHTIAIRPDGTTLADATPGAWPPIAAPAVRPAAPPAPAAKPIAPPQHAAAVELEPAPAPPHAGARSESPPPRNAPLSLNQNTVPVPTRALRAERPMRTANAAATESVPTQSSPGAPSTGHYAVQISAHHNEADAQASLRSLEAKYRHQLGGQHTMVRRVDLGTKGVYYRAMVGPFASSDAARHMCSELRAAGARCFVKRIQAAET